MFKRTVVLLCLLLWPVIANAWTVTFTVNDPVQGALSGSLSQEVANQGSTTQVTATASPNYHFVDFTGTGFTTTNTNPLIITNVTSNLNISANFAPDRYDVITHGLLDVQDFKGGASHSVVLKNDGTVIAWGGGDGQSNINGDTSVKSIAAGVYHSLAARTNDTLAVSGNWYDNTNAATPVTVTPAVTAFITANNGVKALAGGYGHSVILSNNGTVFVWGNNDYYTQLDFPAALSGATITAIAAGHNHTLALTSDGHVIAWGMNDVGQSTVPDGLSGVVAIDAKAYHSVALKSDGTVVCWGANEAGQSTIPNGLTGVAAIAAGGHHTIALTLNGTIVTWGDNSHGQLNTPNGLNGITAIAGGTYFTLAKKGNVALIGWGNNASDQCNVPVTAYLGVTGGILTCDPGTVDYLGSSTCSIAPAGTYGLSSLYINGIDSLAGVISAPTLGKNPSFVLTNIPEFRTITGVYSTAPGAPSIASVAAANGQATVTLNPGPDGGSPVTRYTVSTTPLGGVDGSAATATTRLITGLNKGTPYTFTAYATNMVGDSASTTSGTFTPIGTATIQLGNLTQTYNGNARTVTATTTPSGLSTSITYNGSTTAPVNVGTYAVAATITTTGYTGSATGSLAVNQASQSITVTTPAPGTAQYNSTFPVAATSSSSLPVAITATGACQLASGGSAAAVLRVTASSGTCTVHFNQAGNTNYLAATEATSSATAAIASQTITFGTLSDRTFGAAPFTVSATSSSSLTVGFASLTTSVCTVSGTTVTLTGVGTCTIQASQGGNTNYAAATSINQSFQVASGPLDHFLVTASGPQTAGTPFSITVTAQDSGNHTVTGFSSSVNLTATAGLVTPATIGPFVNGTWTGNVMVTTAGTAKTITATSAGSGQTGTSQPFTVQAGTATGFSVQCPASAAAGAPFTVTVVAKDAYDNVATGYQGTVRFACSDQKSGVILPADYSFLPGDNGSHSFSSGAALQTAGHQTVDASDSTAGITATSNTITINPAGAARLLVAGPATATAGAPLSVTVTVKDGYDNTIADYAGTVHLSSTDGRSVLPADYTFTTGGSTTDNGVHTFTDLVTLKSSGAQTVTATDTAAGTVEGASGSVTVSPAAPAALEFVQQPATVTAGAPIAPAVSVRVVDQYGNTVPGSTVPVTVAIANDPAGGVLAGTTVQDAAAGIATFGDLSINRNGSGYTLAATADSLAPATSASFDVTVGALDHFDVSTVGTGTAGTPFALTVTAKDASGNTIPDFTGTASLAVSGGSSIAPATTSAFTAGVWSGEVSVLTSGTGRTITATNSLGSQSGTSNAFDVVKAAQSIQIATAAPATAAFQESFTTTANATSGLPVAISASGACSGAGSGSAVITMTSGSGTCSISYLQDGNADFEAATVASSSSTATRLSQGITVTTTAPVSAGFGTSFTVAATAPGGAVTYVAAGGCTGSGATFTMTSGTTPCTVTYEQAGNLDYQAAPPVTSSTAAVKADQVITVTTAAPSRTALGSSFTVAATAPGGAVSFASAGGCTNNGATFTMTSATTACTVTFGQTGNNDYAAAPQYAAETAATPAVPGSPAMGAATAVNGQASCSFAAPAFDGGSAITTYTVTSTPGNLTATGTGSPIVVTGLTNGTAYTFTVHATNSAGKGSESNASASVTPLPNGDINGDGVVDIRDAQLALKAAAGVPSVTPAMIARADVAPLAGGIPHGDGRIDVGDVTVILRRAVGLVTW
ncbi:MBG domain-containing protein [Geomonas sp. Red32]|uniref:MBG domain-containing protein n=1 Tax=Geomonas sp. Red32 TaxID=2912856 RepID=UPI00202CDC12|nr:MBG domain-containing protein [Geomonas sp. Red32]MCM0083260.1 MBG domain-containing protein [Geomonas sp. Red32]